MSSPTAEQLASRCLASFDECLKREALTQNQWAENRRADFSLWVDGVGALAGKNASLDDRFVSKPRELVLTLNLLLQLQNYLEDCLSATERTQMEEAKRNADAAIENLASMAVAIRRTGRKSRLIRADNGFKSTALEDLRIHLKCIALIESTLADREQHGDRQETPLWWQDKINAKLSPLQHRLIEANLRRRNRFLYAQSHSQKLAHRLSTGESTNQDAVERSPVQSENSHVRKQPDNSARSGTFASTPESKLQWPGSKNIARTPRTQISFVTATTLYPKFTKPPRPEVGGSDKEKPELPKMIKCPCCCEAIPYSMLETETAWKQHLSRDLCPYTCIASQCPVPHLLFRTRAEWEDHLKEQHPKTWKCQLCDEPDNNLFQTDDQLVEHVREEHKGSLPPNLLKTVRLWPSNPFIGLDFCPLCHVTGPRDSPKLISHVLEHTHNFALRSLPWADLSVDNGTSSMSLGMFNVGYLQSVKPTEREASLRPWLMNDWFETLESPTPEQGEWERAESTLKHLAAGRIKKDAEAYIGHFITNDYFASDADSLSLDREAGQALSRGSFDTDSSVGSMENAETRTGQGQWSDWIWSEVTQRYYRQRQNNNDMLDTEWQQLDSESATRESNDEASTEVLDGEHSENISATPLEEDEYVHSQAEYVLEQDDQDLQKAIEASRDYYGRASGEGSTAASAYVQSFDYEDEDPLTSPAGISHPSHNAGTEGEMEHLDPRYRVEHSNKFQPGEIFKVLWSEPGTLGSESAPSVSEREEYRDRYGSKLFVGFRRFIVIANDQGHCTCVPIFTYGGKACTKKGTKPKNHGIIFEKGHKAKLLSGEPKLGFAPVKAEIYQDGEGIRRESRINYSKLITVEHNVKVFFIGRVAAADYDIVADAVNQCWEEKIHRKKKRPKEEPPADSPTLEDEG
ncbi:hypothetical protein EDB81DRAFT_952291 [Dactylonectria macrodidyma]|uniref:C2H2-type domain-containing protein n=1 Tax=Dactylonectria macrodidyma TaxID=307937 RepID=A0A9P9DN68_9HYPO|nr:hypothetical protein EDB81DRAFT_952291 [Dactylonectria macrodidyma]